MKEFEQKFVIRFPEEYAGEVMGKLSAEDALLEKADNENGIFTVTAIHSKNKIKSFEQWLNKATSGKGNILNIKM